MSLKDKFELGVSIVLFLATVAMAVAVAVFVWR